MKKIILILVLVIFPINTFAWYTELDNPDIRIDRSKVTAYEDGTHIPFEKNPNLDTLKFYIMNYNIEGKPRASSRIIKN